MRICFPPFHIYSSYSYEYGLEHIVVIENRQTVFVARAVVFPNRMLCRQFNWQSTIVFGIVNFYLSKKQKAMIKI